MSLQNSFISFCHYNHFSSPVLNCACNWTSYCNSFSHCLSYSTWIQGERARPWRHVLWLKIVFLAWHVFKVVRRNNPLYHEVLRDCWHRYAYLFFRKIVLFIFCTITYCNKMDHLTEIIASKCYEHGVFYDSFLRQHWHTIDTSRCFLFLVFHFTCN